MSLSQELFGASFKNPVMLAAGTCGFGQELIGVADLDKLGGLVTKSVTREPRNGNPAPRITEFGAGMLNSIGLANPGVDRVRAEKLPWIRDHLAGIQVFVSVAGGSPEDYRHVVQELDAEEGFLGFELNLSCPNDTTLHGLPFALDTEALARVIETCRPITDRPLLAKLAPNAPDPAQSARIAEAAGADGLTMVNTLPGLVIDPETGNAELGAGPGGVSGPALRPVGVHAVWRAAQAVEVPVIGAGGITSGRDAIQYLRAGASLVQVGTASFADPRTAERVANALSLHLTRHGEHHVSSLVGTLNLRSPEERPEDA